MAAKGKRRSKSAGRPPRNASLEAPILERLRSAMAEEDVGSAAELLGRLELTGDAALDERTVRRYLAGETSINRSFLRAAAEALGVMPAWLEFGQPPRHVETSKLLKRQGTAFRPQFHPWDIDAIASLGLTNPQRNAVLAYSAVMHAASTYDIETLVAAARFLAASESTMQALRAPGLVRMSSASSPGHYAAWAAAVLNSFSLYVVGLGSGSVDPTPSQPVAALFQHRKGK